MEHSPLCYILSASVTLNLVLRSLSSGVATEMARILSVPQRKAGGCKGLENAAHLHRNVQLQRACRNAKMLTTYSNEQLPCFLPIGNCSFIIFYGNELKLLSLALTDLAL